MQKFTLLRSTCIVLRTENIDTDQIIPARFLKTTKRVGLGRSLFYNLRFNEKGAPRKGNIFDTPFHKDAKILIAGNNFGCGSSREHAVWALLDYGFKTVVSSSFGDIFYNNSLKNGLLPVGVTPKPLETLMQRIAKNPKTTVTIDLLKQTLRVDPLSLGFHFTIDAFRKLCLLQGKDEVKYIMSHEKEIRMYESTHHTYLTVGHNSHPHSERSGEAGESKDGGTIS